MPTELEPKEISTASLKADSESIIEAALNGAPEGEKQPEDSSTSQNAQEEIAEESQEAVDDQQKTSEEKLEKEGEESKKEPEEKSKDPRDLAFRKGYNEAKAKLSKEIEALRSLILPKEVIEEFNRMKNSPSVLRLYMKDQGYTDEAINSRLKDLGHKVEEKSEDTLQLVLNKLGVDKNNLSEEQKNYVNTYLSDVVKVADILMQERFSKILPSAIKPLEDKVGSITRENQSSKILAHFEKTVKDEGVLDYAKDIEPELEKWLDANDGKKSMEDFVNFFGGLNHKLTIERLRAGKRKEERDTKKGDLRNLSEGGNKIATGKLPKWDKNKTDGDNVGSILDSAGILQ